MTGVQAMIAAGIFGLGVAAPLIGLPVAQLGWLNAIIFALGAAGAARAGVLCKRWGSVRVAAACVLCVVLASLLMCLPTNLAIWPAAVLLGLAFGPETPASSASLVRVCTPAQRNWVIALRQTGNQWGAIAASLCLPPLLIHQRTTAFGLIALLSLLLFAYLLRSRLRSINSIPYEDAATSATFLHTLAEQWKTRGMPALLALSASYAAMQIAINGFAFSFLVRTLAFTPAMAGALLATAQGAGLLARIVLSAWARRASSTATALGCIGPGIALSITTLSLLPSQAPGVPPSLAIFGLMFVAGFLVSGWNGLLLAELARLAGPARTAAWTGATMSVSYAGLVAAPLLFALGGEHLRQTYLILALLCALSGVAVLLTRPPPAKQAGANA
jgi:Major Facilitator Superfamily